MDPTGTHDLIELLVRNLSWMTGNLFLAWAPMLFALHLRGSARSQRIAAGVLVVAVPLMLFARLSVKGTTIDAPLRTLVVVAVVGIAAATWSVRVRAGDRWAHWLGYLGVLAFAPNAPYVMTDLFHHVQDVRLAGGTLVGNVLTSIEYGWFLVLGTAAWVALVDVGRDWLRRHRPGIPGWRVLLPVCGLMAFGIYLGRIERFHSWHPLGEPGRFVREVGIALTSPGPIAFTVIWWGVTFAAAVAGLWLLDRARAAGPGGVRALVVHASWVLTGVLLASSPLVPAGYSVVGIDVADHSPRVALASVVLGIALVVVTLRHADVHVRTGRRFATVGAVAVLVVPLTAGLVAGAAIAQWYAQFRGLCEYGPAVNLHGETC